MLDLLVIAPHPDDAELGMGGSLLRFKAEGLKVGVLDLTSGEPTPHGSPEIRARETAAATEILKLDWRENLGLPNRSLEPTLEARRRVAEVIRRVRPKLLFAPYWVDAHPDHVAATQIVEAARFWAKLTKTDMPGEPFYPARILYYWCVHLRVVDPPALRARHQRLLGRQAQSRRVLRQPISCRSAGEAADLHRPRARSGRVLGLVDRHALRRTILESRADRAHKLAQISSHYHPESARRTVNAASDGTSAVAAPFRARHPPIAAVRDRASPA